MFGSRLYRLTTLAVTTTLATGALMLGVLPALNASAAKPPRAPSVTLVCASAESGGFGSVSVTGTVTNLRPNTSFSVAVNQPPSFNVTTADPSFTSDANGVLSLNAVTIDAATDGNPPYTSGKASFNALETDLIGVQAGGQGILADLNVKIGPKCL